MIEKLIRFANRRILGRQQATIATPPNFGIKTGEGTVISKPRRPIDGKQYISFGNNSYLGPDAWLCAYDNYPYSNQQFTPEIIVGNNVFLGSYATITGINKIIIEDGVDTSDFLYISDHTHSLIPEEGVSVRKRRLLSRGYVRIGAYSALGIHVSILPGVSLGKYCVVGAHSVVTRSFPDYCIIMGNPAVVMRTYSMEEKKWMLPGKTNGIHQANAQLF